MRRWSRPLPIPLFVAALAIAVLLLADLPSAIAPPWQAPPIAPVIGHRYTRGSSIEITTIATPDAVLDVDVRVVRPVPAR